MSGASNTVRLHRVLPAPAERIYQAFLDPDALSNQNCPRPQPTTLEYEV